MKRNKILFIISLLLSTILLTGFTFFLAHFAPWVEISTEFFKVNVGLKTQNQTISLIDKELTNISIEIKGRDKTISIPLSDVGTLNKVKIEEKISGKTFNKEIDMKFADIFSFDEAKLYDIVSTKMGEIEKRAAQNAYIDFVNGTYVIVPEENGNIIKDDIIEKAIEKVKQYIFTIDLEELDAYENAEITKENKILNQNLNLYKQYENFSLLYTINNQDELIDIHQLKDWLKPNFKDDTMVMDAENPFTVDEQKINEFIEQIKSKYSFTDEDVFTTSTNEKIVYSNMNDKTWLDEDVFKNEIVTAIIQNVSCEKDIPIKTKPDIKNTTSKPISNTYIEVSIENQRIWVYNEGELILESDIVTGNLKRKHDTRKGVFNLTYKCRNATLRGPGYASFVNYWMPFDGGIGLHDATWRDEFGGEIYKTDGSHGCVNLPLETAKTIYDFINKDIPIIVW